MDAIGAELGHRWTPLNSVGLYVPGGKASYPSSVLMNAIPAKVAGVPRLVMVVPTPGGEVNPAVLAAAHLAGISEVYRIGGAQAVAALAYGTETIEPVAKIVGPGNAYVAEAKRQVFGTVGIDTIAGPSEVVVVADKGANPEWLAADLLAQAEHDEAAQSILIADDEALAGATAPALENQIAAMSRGAIAGKSWADYGAIILVSNLLEEARALVNALAPEHLELACDMAEAMIPRIRNAGAIFIGHHTPEAVGDYTGGSNHVLPTARAARFASGLGVLDFMKRTSLLKLNRRKPCGARGGDDDAGGSRRARRTPAFRGRPPARCGIKLHHDQEGSGAKTVPARSRSSWTKPLSAPTRWRPGTSARWRSSTCSKRTISNSSMARPALTGFASVCPSTASLSR